MFSSPWQDLVASPIRKSFRTRRYRLARQRRNFQLLLEQFEDRVVPTVLSLVPSVVQTGRGTDVVVSLNTSDLHGTDDGGFSGGGFVIYYDPKVFSTPQSNVGPSHLSDIQIPGLPAGSTQTGPDLGGGPLGRLSTSGPADQQSILNYQDPNGIS